MTDKYVRLPPIKFRIRYRTAPWMPFSNPTKTIEFLAEWLDDAIAYAITHNIPTASIEMIWRDRDGEFQPFPGSEIQASVDRYNLCPDEFLAAATFTETFPHAETVPV